MDNNIPTKGGKTKYWVIIILAATVAVAAVLYYEKQLSIDMTHIVMQQQTKTQPATTTTPEGDFKDWKTYADAKNKFQFKYPNQWVPEWPTIDKAGIIWVNFSLEDPASTKNTLYLKIFPNQKLFTSEKNIISSNAHLTPVVADDSQAGYYSDFTDIPTAFIAGHNLFLEIGEPNNGDHVLKILSTFKFTK